MLPCCRRMCKSRSLSRRPIRSCHCIGATLLKRLCWRQIIGLPLGAFISYRLPVCGPVWEVEMTSIGPGPLRHARRFVTTIVFAIAATQLSASSSAGSWPERTVRVILPAAAGSSIDVAARLYAERLAAVWGKPVVIDNRAGADGILAVQGFLQGNDDHNLLFAFPGIITVVPLLHERIPYDPATDLVPISSAAYDFLCVAVSG